MLGWLLRAVGLKSRPSGPAQASTQPPRSAPLEPPEEESEEEYVFRESEHPSKPSWSAAEALWIRQKRESMKKELGLSDDDFKELR